MSRMRCAPAAFDVRRQNSARTDYLRGKRLAIVHAARIIRGDAMRVVMLGVCALLAAGVFATMFVTICRSHAVSDVPPGVRRRLTIELVWAAIPCLLVVAAFVPAVVKVLEESSK